MSHSDGTHETEVAGSPEPVASANQQVSAASAPSARGPLPAKLYHKGYGIPVDQLHQYAQAVADGKLTVEQLSPQLPPAMFQAVIALAGEIAAARIPLVAIGPDWRFVPPAANYVHPDAQDHFIAASLARQVAAEPSDPAWRVLAGRIAWLLLGVALGMAMMRFLP